MIGSSDRKRSVSAADGDSSRSPKRIMVAGPSRLGPAAAVAGLAGTMVAVRLVVLAGDPEQGRWRLLAAITAAWVAFAVGAWGVRRMPARAAVPLLVLGGLALQAVAMTAPPRLSDDYYRYAWDGRVQAAGISPYAYPPTDEALADLRTPWLFPPGCTTTTDGVQHVCTRMNHPLAVTIYPPVAQAAFLAGHVVTAPLGEDGGRERSWQVLGAALATATTVALLAVLRRRGDPRQVVLWAWCPTVVLETGGNAHIDVLASLLVVLALGAVARGRRQRGGVLLGLAIATKLLPVVLLPALAGPLRERVGSWLRGPGRLALVAGVVLALTYLPHLVVVGTDVLGYLPGYLPEEGFDGQTRFPLLRPLPGRVAAAAGLVLLAALAGWALRTVEPDRPWSTATVLVGLTFVVVGFSYPWYALLLVPLVALDGRGRWLAVAAAAYPAYLAPALGFAIHSVAALAYAVALVVALGPDLLAAPGRALRFRREVVR